MTDAERNQIAYVVAQLRHAYKALHEQRVFNQLEFAQGLIAPQIRILEQIITPKVTDG